MTFLILSFAIWNGTLNCECKKKEFKCDTCNKSFGQTNYLQTQISCVHYQKIQIEDYCCSIFSLKSKIRSTFYLLQFDQTFEANITLEFFFLRLIISMCQPLQIAKGRIFSWIICLSWVNFTFLAKDRHIFCLHDQKNGQNLWKRKIANVND